MDLSSGKIEIVNPGRLAAGLAASLHGLDEGAVVRRIWERDPSVWKPDGREISDRLGWLDAPAAAEAGVPDMETFAASVRGEGFVRAVVLGMGGSSLAPEVFARSFPTATGGLELEILDTTEPGAVADAAARLDLRRTLFLVSSKSGSTAELVALLSFFYERIVRALGEAAAGSRFVAITDPASPLEALAASLRFRRIFHGRSDIGGRFSALSAFGLLPAALKGIDLGRLLSSAERGGRRVPGRDRHRQSRRSSRGGPGFGGAPGHGQADPPRPAAAPSVRGLARAARRRKHGQGRPGHRPGHRPRIRGRAAPGRETGSSSIFRTPLPRARTPGSGRSSTGANPSSASRSAIRTPSAATSSSGSSPRPSPAICWGSIPSISPTSSRPKRKRASSWPPRAAAPPRSGPRSADAHAGETPAETLAAFLAGRRDGDYLAVLAFLPRRPGVETALSGLAERLGRSARLPVTVGFGPRYLHSTGQLHKGDGNKGLFLMLLAADLPEVAIPEVPGIVRPAPGFAGLFRAQARGDGLALAEKGRRVLTVELAEPLEAAIAALEPPST